MIMMKSFILVMRIQIIAANIDVGLVTYGMRKLPNDTCPDFEFKQFKEIGALLND